MRIIIFLLVVSFFSLGIAVEAMLAPTTNLDLFLDHNMIVVGEIISERSIAPKPGSHIGTTEYEIFVDRYLKSPQSFKKITASGLGSKNSTSHITNETIFNIDQKVLLYLSIVNEKYVISPYSGPFFGEINNSMIPPPLKLYKNGVSANDIVCNLSFQKILKPSGMPACIKPESLAGFMERGWIPENLNVDG